jgi:hypothetical protein
MQGEEYQPLHAKRIIAENRSGYRYAAFNRIPGNRSLNAQTAPGRHS